MATGSCQEMQPWSTSETVTLSNCIRDRSSTSLLADAVAAGLKWHEARVQGLASYWPVQPRWQGRADLHLMRMLRLLKVVPNAG